MSAKRNSFPPLPPTVDLKDPALIHWRIDRLERAVEHLESDAQGSPAAVAAVALLIVSGLTGLISPDVLRALLQLLVQLP